MGARDDYPNIATRAIFERREYDLILAEVDLLRGDVLFLTTRLEAAGVPYRSALSGCGRAVIDRPAP